MEGLDAADHRFLDGRGHNAVRVHGEVNDVRLEEVLRAPFPDNLEVVHEGVRDAALRLDRRRPLRLTCGVIGRTARQSHAGDPLGIEVESDGEVAARALSGAELGEERAAQMDRLAAGLFGGKDDVEWDLLGGCARRS